MNFRCGLVVGKFCPLHLGHESVIAQAFASCDEVLIISYSKPEFEGLDRKVRADWLTATFPAATVLVVDDAFLCAAGFDSAAVPPNDAPDHVQRQFVGWLCREVLHKVPDAVFTSEDYGDGFAAALTVLFGAPVQHVCVDKARSVVPVSGTQVRGDPHAWRRCLSARVYAHYVARVCVLGGESSGKTSLAQALAAQLGTAWVPEYGRQLWDERGGQLRYEDMTRIGLEQVARETALLETAARWLLCDTSPLTTLFYSLELFGRADPALERLALRDYDTVFVCAPDFPFVQDGTRRDGVFRQRQHDWYLAQLTARSVPFTVLHGSLEARVHQACAVLLS